MCIRTQFLCICYPRNAKNKRQKMPSQYLTQCVQIQECMPSFKKTNKFTCRHSIQTHLLPFFFKSLISWSALFFRPLRKKNRLVFLFIETCFVLFSQIDNK